VKRSLGTTPCVVKDSSCHIMQGDFGGTIYGGGYTENKILIPPKKLIQYPQRGTTFS